MKGKFIGGSSFKAVNVGLGKGFVLGRPSSSQRVSTSEEKFQQALRANPRDSGMRFQQRKVTQLQNLVRRRDYSGMLRIVTPELFRRGLRDTSARKALLRVERDLLREAERLLRKGDFKTAQKLLNRVLRLGGTLRSRAQRLIQTTVKKSSSAPVSVGTRRRAATRKKNGGGAGAGNGSRSGSAQQKTVKKAKKKKEGEAKAPAHAERRGGRAETLVEEVVRPGPVPTDRRGQEQKQQQEVLRRTPHMDLSPDAPLEPGTAFDVYVSADTKSARPGEEGEEVILEGAPSQEEFPVQVTLIVSGHFQLLEDRVKLMTILRSTESAPVVFKVSCMQAFPAEQNAALSALFTYDGHPSGRVTRRFRVENGKLISMQVPPTDAGGKQPATLQPKVAVSTGLDAYDLTISVLDTGENDGRHFHLIADAPAIGKRLESTWNLGTRTEQIVSNYMKRFVADNLKPTTRLAELTGAGVELFRATPGDFQKLFWEMIDAGKPPNTILVVSDDPYIPWELMVPRRTVPGKVPETRRPLGVEFSVGRWIRGDYTSPPQQISLDRTYVIAPNYVMAAKNLKWAPQEAKFVCESFQPSRAIDPADLDKIREALQEHGATLLHFICHGAAGAGADQTVYLRDMVNNLSCAVVEGSDEFVTAFFRDHTFVFLNACEVGRTAPALVGINGLPVTFLRLGASGVIAALWSVKDDLAHQVAEKFYTAVLQQPQIPFAEILRDIRSQAYTGRAEDTYAAYCFYGSPLAKRKL